MAKKTVKKSAPKTKSSTKKKPVKKKEAGRLKKSAVKSTMKKSAKKETTAKKVQAKKKQEKKLIKPKTIRVTEKKKKEKKKAVEVQAEVKVPKGIETIKGYSKKDLEHFKKIIMEKHDEIIEQLQNLREQMLDPTTGEYINENSPYSLHMAEQGTDAMEREKTFLYAQRENKFLGYLEDALKRIDAGTYGICIECIEEPQHLCETCPLVPKARLEAVPHSQLCLPIKQRQEKK